MKRFVLLSPCLVVLATAVSFAQEGTAKKPAGGGFATPRERASYGIGRSIGEQLKGTGFDLDVTLIARGIGEVLSGVKASQTDEEVQGALAEIEKLALAESVGRSKTFLETNGKKAGVTTTKSGLQYQVLKEGTGKRPTAEDSVRAHYAGTFLDGKTFDSSYDRGEPAVFPLNGVIRGWTEGVPLMTVGSKYKFWIPSDLAYGPRGRPGIPPNSLLVFEIELLEVMPAEGGGDLPVLPKKK